MRYVTTRRRAGARTGYGWLLRNGELSPTWHWLLEVLLANDRPIRILGPMCSATGCLELAEWRVWWPSDLEGGQPNCERHATGWTRIGAAMGFVVPAQRIDVPADVRMMLLADHRAAISREAAELEERLALDPTAARFAAMELD